MIDIIIPAYNSHDYIENAICSILMQTLKDKINIYIVDDCSDRNYNEIVEKYKDIINIKEIKTTKNSGPGVARQLGIDKSKSEFILFIDADDIFDNCYSIERLYNAIIESNSNIISSYFTEETDNGSIDHHDNTIWLHGKIYRRSFLKKNNIRFNNTRANEDTGFNKLIYFLTEVLYIPDYTYIWKCNNKSLTRSTDYNFYGLEGFVYNICWAIEEGLKRTADVNKIANVVYGTIVEMYYRYIYYYEREEKSLLLEWTKELKRYYIKYYSILNDEEKRKIIADITMSYINELETNKLLNNELTLNEFIDLI